MMHARARVLAALAGLLTALSALPAAADPEPGEDAQASTVIITGDDPDLVASVADELRAAGFEVIVVGPDPAPKPNPASAVVTVTRAGDSVVVHTTRPDGELDAEILHPEGTGLSDRDATALRAAEAIRSLVGAPGPHAPAPPSAPPAALASAPLPPPAPPPLPAPPLPATPPLVETVPMVWMPPADALLSEPIEVPVFRLGIFGGAGYVAPTSAAALGLTLRGQINPRLDIAGMLLGTHFIGETKSEGYSWEMYTARAALLVSWEILGADHSWTPTLGGGPFWEYRRWRGDSLEQRTVQDGGGPDDEPIVGELALEESENGDFTTGLAVTAGVTVSHPLRFRFDVYGDMRISSWGENDLAPDPPGMGVSIIGLVGIEYDIVTRKVRVPRTARNP